MPCATLLGQAQLSCGTESDQHSRMVPLSLRLPEGQSQLATQCNDPSQAQGMAVSGKENVSVNRAAAGQQGTAKKSRPADQSADMHAAEAPCFATALVTAAQAAKVGFGSDFTMPISL